MKLKDIIGLKIKEIRYTYTDSNDYGMQEFYSYIKLSNDIIMDLPTYPDQEIGQQRDVSFYLNSFNSARSPIESCKERIENIEIVDFHFSYYNGKVEVEDDQKAYIELSNGIYFTEQNYGPKGVTTVDLHIWNSADFEAFKLKELESDKEIKPLKNTT